MDRALEPVLIFPQPNHSIVRVLISISQILQSTIFHIFQLSDSAFNVCKKKKHDRKNAL